MCPFEKEILVEVGVRVVEMRVRGEGYVERAGVSSEEEGIK